MQRNWLSFIDRDFFIGPFAMAVLAMSACNDASGEADGGDGVAARGLPSEGQVPGGASDSVAAGGLASGTQGPGEDGDGDAVGGLASGTQGPGEEGNVAVRNLASGGQAAGDESDNKVNDDAEGHVEAGVDADGDGACTALAPPVSGALPRVATKGTRATAVLRQIAALLAAREPPVAVTAQTIETRNLFCSKVFTPFAAGASCSLDVSLDGAAPVKIETRNRELAESLFGALVDAGAGACQDFAHRDSLHLSHVVIDPAKASFEFDDASQYALPPSPNVRASGAEGAAVVAAMQSASINDCDPSRTVFVVCNKQAATPACSTTFFPLEQIGGSALVNICLPQLAVADTVQLGAADALALWNAIVGAAAASGYTPLSGTLEQATVINAKHFTWDGSSVGFLLTADDAIVPPSLPD